ncbi:hypothetical protein [Aeromonas veronii]|uniref:hypothetical protein n=1 Tax=Aeromonas veronii TaxID=654 RepID=UPI003B9E8BAA
MKSNKCINLLLIGFGPHSKRIYYPLLELSADDQDLNLCAAVELESSRTSVDNYLLDKHLKPEMIYIDDVYCQFEQLHDSVVLALNKVVKKHKINGVIIATEPLAHLSYAKWALESGLSILMDKPISSYEGVSTSVAMSEKIAKDYYELNDMYQRQRRIFPNLVFSLMAQRRYQTSFNLIKDRIDECFKKTNCPVTNVQTFHSDGQWRMPTEIVEQHYHPYNQGYGKCSHSGYHYFDIIPYVLESGLGYNKCYDSVDIFSLAVRPTDVLEQFNIGDYRKIFGSDIFNEYNKYEQDELIQCFKEYGEVDCSSNIAFKKDKRIITSVSVNLTHNGYSQRNWVTAQGRDLYKGNGRVSHESHIFQQGPFQTIHFHSYKSDESTNGQDRVGTKEHLEIYIFRNHKMLGGKHVEQFNIDDLIEMEGGRKGLVGKSKAKAFYEFIAGMRGQISAEKMRSDFSKHEAGSILISAIYQSICHQFLGLDALIQKPLIMDGRRKQLKQNDKTTMVA